LSQRPALGGVQQFPGLRVPAGDAALSIDGDDADRGAVEQLVEVCGDLRRGDGLGDPAVQPVRGSGEGLALKSPLGGLYDGLGRRLWVGRAEAPDLPAEERRHPQRLAQLGEVARLGEKRHGDVAVDAVDALADTEGLGVRGPEGDGGDPGRIRLGALNGLVGIRCLQHMQIGIVLSQLPDGLCQHRLGLYQKDRGHRRIRSHVLQGEPRWLTTRNRSPEPA
jgi:hypothetical protein